MPNAKDASASAFQRILVLGKGGAGKTQQIVTLPGRKFVYIFDPGALPTLRGYDIDYEAFLPDALELDSSLKGFNKGAKNDVLAGSKREPSTYMRFVEDLNKKHDAGFFADYDWLCFDSMTLLAASVMDRQLFINNRYGAIEDLGDYRVVGTKIADVMRSIFSIQINIYCTGHINTYQDDKTKRIDSAVNLPGKARVMLPLLCSNIWELRSTSDDKAAYTLLTKAEPRGFQEIRTSIKGLAPTLDVTIKDFARPELFGIGAMLTKAGAVPLRAKAASPPVAATPPPATVPPTPSPVSGAAVKAPAST